MRIMLKNKKKPLQKEIPPLSTPISKIESDKEVKQIQKEILTLVDRAQNFQIVSEKTFIEATEVIGWIRTQFTKVDVRRKFFVDPLNDHVKAINKLFKDSWLTPLNTANEIMTKKVLDEQAKRRRAAELEAARIKQEQIKQAQEEKQRLENEISEAGTVLDDGDDLVLDMPALEFPPEPVQPKSVGAVNFAMIWTYELEDISKVPLDFITLDDAKIKAQISSGTRAIPGIRIFEKETLRRSGR